MIARGVLYVVYGDRARAQFLHSRASLRSVAPSLSVAVVSDTPIEVDDVVTIIHPNADPGARVYKTGMYSLTPFEDTLFLDADTIVKSSPEPGFNLLKCVDLVLAQDVNRNFATNKWPHLNPEEVKITGEEIGSRHHMYFNSGVIFFTRNERVERMMTAWADEWNRYGQQDQMALLRAIHKNPVRIAPMRAPWNTHHEREAVFVYHKHRAARREGAPR